MIRKATTTDIDVILDITKACANHMISNGLFQWNESYPNRSAFENDVNRGELFVIEFEKAIVGCIVISNLMDEEYIPIEWLTPSLNNAYIHRLAIHPNHQRKGLAIKLMDFAENFAAENGYCSIRLDTFSQNLKNQNFYEQRGYKRLGNIFFLEQSEFPFYCYELIL